jgi:hypothetical protein
MPRVSVRFWRRSGSNGCGCCGLGYTLGFSCRTSRGTRRNSVWELHTICGRHSCSQQTARRGKGTDRFPFLARGPCANERKGLRAPLSCPHKADFRFSRLGSTTGRCRHRQGEPDHAFASRRPSPFRHQPFKIDLIGFAHASSFGDIQANLADDANGNAVITLGDGQSITLRGVDASLLTAGLNCWPASIYPLIIQRKNSEDACFDPGQSDNP